MKRLALLRRTIVIRRSGLNALTAMVLRACSVSYVLLSASPMVEALVAACGEPRARVADEVLTSCAPSTRGLLVEGTP